MDTDSNHPTKVALSMTLQEFLKKEDVSTVDVLKDGFCLFSAVKTVLEEDYDIHRSVMELRQLTKHEMQMNAILYKPFCADSDDTNERSELRYTSQVNAYLDRGIYNNELGDTCVSGLCNVLGMELVIFQEELGYMTQTHCLPTNTPVKVTVRVVRYGSGSGSSEHYEALVQKKSKAKAKEKSVIVKRKVIQSTLDCFSKKGKLL